MMIFLLMLFATWLLWRCMQPRKASFEPFSGRRFHALSLGRPMAQVMGVDGFFNGHCSQITVEGQALLRVPLLHIAGLQGDAGDEAVRQYFANGFERQWLRIDLHSLQATDDPRAALAFACVRCAFLMRCAVLFGWLAPDVGWRVLLLNAQRAQDCFDSWADFGHAYLTGRRQWVRAFRADALGEPFDEQRLEQLLAPGGHWDGLPWRDCPPLSPELQTS
ncbi:DUF1266 domain-containing protein [Pseudomonas sp. NPDC089401]|uniref:DUF1266 domain-containing protein n=1 Tax=Pseudomonas sp. NPDC089401 TaxID=3364462 RepID=UPI003814822F